MSYYDVLQAAGAATIDDFILIDGGPMMGKVVTDLSIPVKIIAYSDLLKAKKSSKRLRDQADAEELEKSRKKD